MEARNDLVASAAYQPEPAAVAAARQFVRETLQSWLANRPAPESRVLVDDAVLLTSELVTNAVVHAGTPVEVTCKLAGAGVEVVVRDSHPARMVPGLAHRESVPAERTSGRGLLLPSALASAWGVTYGQAAKAVWFRIGLAAGAGASNSGDADPPAAANAASAPGDAGGLVAAQARPAAQDAVAQRGTAHLGGLSYDELLLHTVQSARAAVAADAAYALVANEDGNLAVRATAGISPSALPPAAPSVASVPFIVDGRIIGVLVVAAVQPGRFSEDEARALQQLADLTGPALERSRLSELERSRRTRAGVLAETTDLLAGAVDQESILALAGQIVVPRLAEWCAVLLAGPSAALRPAAVRHSDESRRQALSWLLGRACAGAPWSTRLAATAPGSAASWSLTGPWLAEAPPGAAALAAAGAWCFPLTTRGRAVGLLVIGGRPAGRLPREVAGLAGDLARRIALAVDSAGLAARQQLTYEALRRSLVPRELPRIPGVELAMAHDLAGGDSEAGADFCDVFPVGGGRWRFAIGEACGSGPEIAAGTSLARNALRILAREGHSIPAVLGRLNQLLLDEGSPGRFLTLVHGEIVTGCPTQVSLVCAGQPPPLLLRVPAAAPVAAVAVQPLLGVIDKLAFDEHTVRLGPGDLLLCVTDGVTRRRDGDRLLDDEDGLARLLAKCAGLTAEVVAAKVQDEVRGFGSRPAADGMALLALRAS